MTAESLEQLKQPLQVGKKSIRPRLVLAPMSGLGHIAYRELVAAFGGYGLLFSEMCSARAIPTENRHTSPFFKWRDAELPQLVCQIFGSEPASMARAARRIESEGFFGVDINFGCSVSAICKRNCGAALLKSPDLAVEIVAAVRKAVSCPLFVKFRTGWKDDPGLAVDLAHRFEDAGADALTFHPRVSPDRRTRPPRWEYITKVKQAVSIPVLGNGDVFSRQDCRKMLGTTGCDGVAIGRIALAKPWIFAAWTQNFQPGPQIHAECALKLADLLEIYYDDRRALGRFKKFLAYFSINFRFGHTLHASIRGAQDMHQVRDRLRQFFENGPEIASRPNMNLVS